MFKSYFGASIEKHLSERWKVGVTIVHRYMETYLCIDLFYHTYDELKEFEAKQNDL